MATTFPLDTPMLPPLVLRPPWGPRTLRMLVLLLAGIFHAVTAGWSKIVNGTEGDIAGSARVLLHDWQWLPVPSLGAVPPGAPLIVWLSKISMALFGVNEFAARLPSSLAVIATVWLTIRLAERFGGSWRGFVAGMLFLCSPGTFTVARLLTPAPLAAGFVTAAFYCLVSGSRRRRGRRRWYLLMWASLVGAAWSGGISTAAVPLAAIVLLLPFYREARIRFLRLISWEGALAIALVGVGMRCFSTKIPIPAHSPAGCGILLLPLLLFPWSLLMLPALWRLATTLWQRLGVDWREAIPLAWIVAGVLAAAVFPRATDPHCLVVWPAFAVWAALRLETMPKIGLLRALGAVLGCAAVGLVACTRLRQILPAVCPAHSDLFLGIPAFFWSSTTAIAFIAVLAFALAVGAAIAFEGRDRRRFTVLALFGAMIPAGYALADISAQFAPYFSYAAFAQCIDAHPGPPHRVLMEGTLLEASSLRFYFVDPLRPFQAAKHVEAGHSPAFLIVPRRGLGSLSPRQIHISCESGGDVLLLTSP